MTGEEAGTSLATAVTTTYLKDLDRVGTSPEAPASLPGAVPPEGP